MSVTPTTLEPSNVAELVEAVRGSRRVLTTGAGTKPRLYAVAEDCVRISTAKLRGIVEYEPSEFTFTALAGTPVSELVAALRERGQYLPFDPMLVRAGATLGGTIASGLSGPGRFRFGGLRDFILGVRFVDGTGRLLRMGGKVVKNSAGFDVPKFLVGSAGRFGAIAEATFKVFPRPPALRTLRLEAADAAARAKLFDVLGRGRWELDALDAPIEEPAVYARIGGPEAALGELAAEVLGRWPGAIMTTGDADFLWQTVTELRWAHAAGAVAAVALAPSQVEAFAGLVRATAGARGWISAGGNAGYLSLPAGTMPPEVAWPGVLLRGSGPLWLGTAPRYDIMQRVKQALDPDGRFPGLDE